MQCARADAAPFGTLADWAVVAFAAGAALYFGLPTEPDASMLLVATSALLASVLLARRSGLELPVLLLAFCLSAGVFRAAWHSDALAHTILPERPQYLDVTGWIEAIETGASGQRMIVRVDTLETYADPPPRVRVNAPGATPKAGEGVAFRARLYRPPPPAIPGGYDSGRAAYFRGIGAYGQLVGDLAPQELELGFPERLRRQLVRTRYRLSEHITARAPPETAGLQAALVTGIRKDIPPDQIAAMRDAGLAHIVAISGLHMAVSAGYAFALASFLLALLPAARLRDMRKPAAAIALVVATAYLLLSGASVSTQRAYIMISVWLTAIIIEREPFSLRSVSVAALVTLAVHPEAILSAGFHMSFAAVAALIVTYGWWNARREFLPRSPARRVAGAFGGLAATSLIAGTATAGYAILHFGRWARYGLIGNLAAMPLFSFITMPAALAALLLMPLGLDRPALAVMGWSLEKVIAIAAWTSALPGAVALLPGGTTVALCVFTCGLVLLLLGRERLRIAGLATLLAIPLTAYHAPAPDIRLNDRGHLTLRDGRQLYTTNLRADGFGRRLWAERSGMAGKTRPLTDHPRCSLDGCSLGGTAIVHHPEDVAQACTDHDLVILTQRSATPVARRHCGARLIDGRTLEDLGSLDIVTGPLVRVTGVRTRSRPWSGPGSGKRR